MLKAAQKTAAADWRKDFPVFRERDIAYLDSAASAQKPQAVIDAMTEVMESHYANIHRGLYEFSQLTTQKFEEVRHKVAAFIGAPSAEEIVFTRNATEAINLVAHSWGGTFLKAGDEIILSAMEHHANIVPWQLLCEKIGCRLKIAPLRADGSLDMAAFEKLLTPAVKLIAIVHISNALGVVNDVKAVTAKAKAAGDIKVLVDGSQAVVHQSVDVRDIGCDFYVFTGHKLYGPTGIGVLWGRYDILEALPPYQGGGDMIERVTFERTTYKKPPARFEAGTPAIVEVIGLGAAIDYVLGVGMDGIMAREAKLLSYAMESLKQIDGLTFYGTAAHKAGIISFRADWGHPSDIGMILDQSGVAVRTGHHCCQPLMDYFAIDATVRASLGLYSTRADIDALVVGLRKARELLG